MRDGLFNPFLFQAGSVIPDEGVRALHARPRRRRLTTGIRVRRRIRGRRGFRR
jgi:hypothetical protein